MLCRSQYPATSLTVKRGTLHQNEKRLIAIKRAVELKERIQDYLIEKDNIATGIDSAEEIKENKIRILAALNGTETDWNDWRWQIRNRISSIDLLKEVLHCTGEELLDILQVETRFRWGISPYYASLMSHEDRHCPVRMQAVPSILELEDTNCVDDPMDEEYTSPAPAITRRYPDRLIINVTNLCAMFCRHCQRRRNIGEIDKNK
ncbi:MAG: lysine 2,3-aminomutase, partial [Bacillota bacterium]